MLKNAILFGGSAFNIKEKSICLADFTQAPVQTLYAIHTEATGQTFTAKAFGYLN
jgi:hypothetical protein